MNIAQSKLYDDLTLRRLHQEYKNCIAGQIEKAFAEGKVVEGEVCLEEKSKYFAYLHSKKRVEHDNIAAFYKSLNDASFE